jgi:hypothetical protein
VDVLWRVVNIQVLLKSLTQLEEKARRGPIKWGLAAPVDIDDEVVGGLLEVGTS